MKYLFLFFVVCGSLFAETLYVTQSGAGTADGSSLGNAWSMASLNTPGNWGVGAGKVSAGDTVSLNGTFTTALTVQGSGSAGNVITLLFATNAKFSAPTWDAGSGIVNLTSRSYITIDGGTNGIIEATANGDGLANDVAFNGVNADGCNNITVQNLSILNLYVRVSGDTGAKCGGIRLTDTGSFVVVDNCTITYCQHAFSVTFNSAGIQYLTISDSSANYCAISIFLGTATDNSTISDVTISGNTFDHWAVWYDAADNVHADGIHPFTNSAANAVITRLYINGNYFGSDTGAHATAAIFVEATDSNDFVDTRIYNNIFLIGSTRWTDGAVAYQTGDPGDALIANNTFVGTAAGGTAIALSSSASGFTIRNNIVTGCGYPVYWPTSSPSSITSDYNDFYSNANTTKTTEGAHSITGNPNLDLSYMLTAGSPCIGAGVDLSGTFTTDKNGVTRTLPWDMGAFKFIAAGGSSMSGKVLLTGKVIIK